MVLRPGIVCDKCNNYFSRKVEEPFLNHRSISIMRFHQALPNKRGRVPPMGGIITPGAEAIIRYYPKQEFTAVEVSPDIFSQLMKTKKGELVIPAGAPPPSNSVISRFLAKIAIESMAMRLRDFPDGLAYLVDEAQLDPIRDHARRGRPTDWPTNVRRLHGPNAKVEESGGRAVQIVHESDILVTDQGEWFFIIAIFGQEYAINLGGPDIEGYQRWIAQHQGASPLYFGKNETSPWPRG